ncbi:short-chain dehydrogenase TIC 32, chloroplastic-like isoform X2 [Papaver somniferum]|uniref:short-chain dehydrogenase TIC 32, chloroplastic-like isoform X2 n=1 Tax=Papaver somniferum TaxID=3469 RepID=UPI000E6F54BE|nr:short-chain dehydrogenase TIC 32, chloroplastic-like isoform X2 [Papaver somniferum]
MVFFVRKGASGFSSSSTAEEVTHGIDDASGSTSGIGAETARVLVMRGVQIVMAVRNTVAGTAAKQTILEETPSAKIEVFELDLSSMASVRKFAAEFKSLDLPLNILISPAGRLVRLVLQTCCYPGWKGYGKKYSTGGIYDMLRRVTSE